MIVRIVSTSLFAALLFGLAWSIPVKPALAIELVALVEQVDGVEDVAVLDFLAPGDLIDLGEDAQITLSYLASCHHEKIQGGIVIIGETNSTASGGVIDVSIVPCKSQEITRQGDSQVLEVVRPYHETRNFLSPEPDVIVFSVFPVFKSLARVASIRLVRLDRDEPERELKLKNGVGDLRDLRVRLEPNGLYRIINGNMDTIFRIDPDAATGQAAILSRLVVI